MEAGRFDRKHLAQDQYDLNDIYDLLKIQRVVEEFMASLKMNAFNEKEDYDTLISFLDFVEPDDVWDNIQSVVPEFRADFLKDHDLTAETGRDTQLNFILRGLQARGRLPITTPPKKPMSTEHRLLARRLEKEVEYVMTGGQGYQAVEPKQQKEGQALYENLKEHPEMMEGEG